MQYPAAPWNLPDDKLLAQCRFEAYVGSGPGGQKRHKTNAAVRITHLPTGQHAVAAESRSQRENRIHAIRRLRHKLALSTRTEIDPLAFRPPAYFAEYPGLHMALKNPLYPDALAVVLDVIKAAHWKISAAAVLLGVTSSALTRFLHDDPPTWTHVNQCRAELGLKSLTWQ
jgi:hypothetical protein